MKRLWGIALLLLAVAVGAAAAETPRAEDAQIQASTAAAIANVFQALKAHDWAQMRKDFDPEMLDSLSKEQLAATFGEVEKRFGAYAANAFRRIERNNKWVLVYHTVKFASGEMILQFTFKANDPTWKIAGLIMRPVEKSPPAK